MAVPPYVSPGDIIDEDWGDQIANSIVNPFNDAAARTTAITTPVGGMLTALTAANSTNGIEQFNGVSWRKPWNMPWGYVASTVTPPTTNQTISTTASTKITGTDTESCSLFANRRYRATCVASYSKITASNISYLQACTSAGAGLGNAWAYNMSVSDRELVVWVVTFTGTTYTGTLQLNAQVLSAGLDVINNAAGARLLVEDIGPNGAPV